MEKIKKWDSRYANKNYHNETHDKLTARGQKGNYHGIETDFLKVLSLHP